MLETHVGRPLTLIAESDLNDARLVTPREAGGYGLDAQWDDDIHHTLHALVTGERDGYYRDFGSLAGLAEVLRSAFVHAGTYSSFRERSHGRPVDRHRTYGYRFVGFLQDHDQIGNRATGDRLSATVPHDLLRIAAMVLFTSAYTPKIFKGEEWAARTPWQYFPRHPAPALAAAVGAGRKAEFARHGWPEQDVPEPQDPATFHRSKLDWDEAARIGHREMLIFYRALITLRKAHPDLSDPRLDRVNVRHGENYLVIGRGRCTVAVNLAAAPITVDVEATDVLLTPGLGAVLGQGTLLLPPRSAAIVTESDPKAL